MTQFKDRLVKREILKTLYSNVGGVTAARIGELASLNRTQVQESLLVLRKLGLVEQNGNLYSAYNIGINITLKSTAKLILRAINAKCPAFSIQSLAEHIGKQYAATQKQVNTLSKAALVKKDNGIYELTELGKKYVSQVEIMEDLPVVVTACQTTETQDKQVVNNPEPIQMQAAQPHATKITQKELQQQDQEVENMVDELCLELEAEQVHQCPEASQHHTSTVALDDTFPELDKELAALQPAPLNGINAKLHIIQSIRDKVPADGPVETHLAELELYLIELAS